MRQRKSDVASPERKLWVVESSGGPRSGKGTITEHLGRVYPLARIDETGADYRAVTLALIEDGTLDPAMSDEIVAQTVAQLKAEHITDLAARRYEIVAALGKEALYSPVVNVVVGKVSQVPSIRQPIKNGFARRVEARVLDDTALLVVDGRNLGPIIQKIAGAKSLLRLFIDCSIEAAVYREAKRASIDLSDPAAQAWYDETYRSIEDRRETDKKRAIDPAVRDPDHINYWYKNESVRLTNQLLALRYGLTEAAVSKRKIEGNIHKKGGRQGVGALAYLSGRQVYFDTTEVGLTDMLGFAKDMVDEALDAASAA
jgi:cytidylate kinase